MEEKVTMVRLNLGSDDVRNIKEITSVKKGDPQFGVYTTTFVRKIQTVGQV